MLKEDATKLVRGAEVFNSITGEIGTTIFEKVDKIVYVKLKSTKEEYAWWDVDNTENV